MATFVHLAPADAAARIRRVGLRPNKADGGVFAMPVVADFMTTYSWSREIRRLRGRLVAVQFRIRDDEVVRMGHYSTPSATATAAEAVRTVMEASDARGFEVVIPRAIRPNEIAHVRDAPRVGWRYSPRAKDVRTTATTCPCPACRTRGEMGEASIRRRIIDGALAPSGSDPFLDIDGRRAAVSVALELGERAAARRHYRAIEAYLAHQRVEVQEFALRAAIEVAGTMPRAQGFDPRRELTRLAELAGELPGPAGRPLRIAAVVELASEAARRDDDAEAMALLRDLLTTEVDGDAALDEWQEALDFVAELEEDAR